MVLVEAALFALAMAYSNLKGQMPFAGRRVATVPAMQQSKPDTMN